MKEITFTILIEEQVDLLNLLAKEIEQSFEQEQASYKIRLQNIYDRLCKEMEID